MKKFELFFATASFFMLSFMVSAANDDAIIKKARELQLSKKYNEAIMLYELNINNTASEKLYLDYATLLINIKKYKDCEIILSNATKIYPSNLRIKNALGQVKYKCGDFSAATSLFSQVLAKDSENKYAKAMLDKIRKEKSSANLSISNYGSIDDSVDSSNDSEFVDISNGMTFNISDSLSVEQQEELAEKLYKELADPSLDKDEVNTYINYYKQIIEKCSKTDYAQESCWRLSNLFMRGVEPPEYNGAISVLEHLVNTYPDSVLVPVAKNRILICCEQSGNYQKVCSIYEQQFKEDPEPDTKTYMINALAYAKALRKCGKSEDAQAWLNKIIELDDGKNALEARAARSLLGEMAE